MIKKALPEIIFLLFFVAACVPLNPITRASDTETVAGVESDEQIIDSEPTSPTSSLTLESIQNTHVSLPFFQKEVQLSDGHFAGSDADGELAVYLLEQSATGDLDLDGQDEFVVLLSENGGGTGWFTSLVVFKNRDGQPTQIGSASIDDRPLIEFLQIEDQTIILQAKIHGFNDPMVDPTFEVRRTYQLVEGHLICMSQSTFLDDGSERMIMIESPLSNSDLDFPFQLIGQMTIAPFENSLTLRALDLSGNLLFEKGIMVDSPDIGMPATFNQSVVLENIPPNEWYQLQLAELSMADGSTMISRSIIIHEK